MNRIKVVVTFGLIMASYLLNGQNTALWLREPAISPDGKTIVFRYKGDLFTVPVEGGKANQITTNPEFDCSPVWSQNGDKIAFSSCRNGNFDVYVMSSEGGSPKRITTNSAKETPLAFSADGQEVFFKAHYIKDSEFSQFPNSGFTELYAVSVNGGRPRRVSSVAMSTLSFDNSGGKLLYEDITGYENFWRKHHKSSVAHNIWLYDIEADRYAQVVDYKYETRNPIFCPVDNNYMYYLSEKDGTMNVYKRNIAEGTEEQITFFENNPVRFLSVDKKGTLCYSYDGEVYVSRDGNSMQKVDIQVITDDAEREYRVQFKKDGINSVEVSPNGKEIAFIIRGDVYVTSAEYSNTRRITNTPEQERNISWSPDGTSIAYSSERNGCWNIYKTDIVDDDKKSFLYADELCETQVTNTGFACFQPAFSPDGEEIAFLENRTELKVINLKNNKIRTVLDSKYNYSYTDGDQKYQWSPDGKWFVVNFFEEGGWNRGEDVGVVKADGSGELHNLTKSGYSNSFGSWVLDGKAITMYSDQYGMRSHGSWGSQNDIYLIFLEQEAYDKFCMNKEEFALYKEAEEEKNKKDKKDKDDKKEDDDDEKIVLPELNLDFENAIDRTVRLTVVSGSHADCFITDDAEKMYYFVSFDKGYDLWVKDFKEGKVNMVAKLSKSWPYFVSDKERKSVYAVSGGKIDKIDLESGKLTPVEINAEYNYRPAEEREYIFSHVWQQVDDKFYDPDIHGIDWEGYKAIYGKFLPHINNNFDFAEMLSEMLGELNASHTGASYYYRGSGDVTAEFGMFFDEEYDGDGLKIKEIIKGNDMIKSTSKIVEGVVIEEIDGQKIKEGEDYYPMLNHKAGKSVVLTLRDGKKQWKERVKLLSKGRQEALLYDRWIEQREHLVDSLSGGRIGYVHVESMDSRSFRKVYSKVFGENRNKEALVVDTRFNGGGWLHDDLATMLGGEVYAEFCPRGQFVSREPLNKWAKPSVVVMNEANYSDAHGFPYVYKTLKLGKLVGMPVAGTMTAVWWENQIDPSIVFGIPQVGVKDMDGNYLENQELQPDIKVNNDPNSMSEGRDLQIEAAVKELLRQIDKK